MREPAVSDELDKAWRVALSPALLAEPVCSASLRREPEDFRVDEILGFVPDGAGPHLWLNLEKRLATTMEVVKLLSGAFDVAERDVGFSGLKDKYAVTSQWFSVPAAEGLASTEIENKLANDTEGHLVLQLNECTRHPKKLKRGWHAANRFAIRARDVSAPAEVLERFQTLAGRGCPNYFGAQRFGRNGANLQRLFAAEPLARGRRGRVSRSQRSMLLSSARSVIFNAVLSRRVGEQSWDQILPGEAVALDGSNSFFFVEDDDLCTIQQRLERQDIHPSGPLWGEAVSLAREPMAAFEQSIADQFPTLVSMLQSQRVEASRRPLRMTVADAAGEDCGGAEVSLKFELARGCFATSVLDQIFATRAAPSTSEDRVR